MTRSNDAYQGLIGLEKLPSFIKMFIWLIGFSLASTFAVLGYFHVDEVMGKIIFRNYFLFLSIVSPTCIAVGLVRLFGVKWRYTLLLFIFVPLVVVVSYLARLFYYLLATGNA